VKCELNRSFVPLEKHSNICDALLCPSDIQTAFDFFTNMENHVQSYQWSTSPNSLSRVTQFTSHTVPVFSLSHHEEANGVRSGLSAGLTAPLLPGRQYSGQICTFD